MGDISEYMDNMQDFEDEGQESEIASLYWTTKKGDKIPLGQLKDDHLDNILKLLLRHLIENKEKQEFLMVLGPTPNGDAAVDCFENAVTTMTNMSLWDYAMSHSGLKFFELPNSPRVPFRLLWKEAEKRGFNQRKYLAYGSEQQEFYLMHPTKLKMRLLNHLAKRVVHKSNFNLFPPEEMDLPEDGVMGGGKGFAYFPMLGIFK